MCIFFLYLFIYRESFNYSEKFILISIIYLTVLPLKGILLILNLNDYYIIIALAHYLISITMVFIYKKGMLPNLHSIFLAMIISLLASLFIYPLIKSIFIGLPFRQVFVFIHTILLGQCITLSMSGSQNSDSIEAAVSALTSAVEESFSSSEDEISKLKREFNILQGKGSRIMRNINNFYKEEPLRERAIEVNNDRLRVAAKIDQLSNNNKCVNTHKKSELYRYVTELNK